MSPDAGPVLSHGIYVALEIEPTPKFTSFLDGLSDSRKNVIPPEAAHTTLMYPYELEREGIFTTPEGIGEVRDEIEGQIGALGLQGAALEIAGQKLRPFGSFFGLPLKRNDTLQAVREVADEVVFERLGVRLEERGAYHVSVGRRKYRSKPPGMLIDPPRSLVVADATVDDREIFIDSKKVVYPSVEGTFGVAS